MIRVLVCLLLMLNFSISITSCTSPGGSDDSQDAISDDELSLDDGSESGGDSADEASDETSDLDADLDEGTDDKKDQSADEDTELAELEEDDAKNSEPAKPSEQSDELDPDLEDGDVASEPATPAKPDVPEEAPAAPAEQVPDKAKVTDIRYVANSSGGTVVIEASKPVTYQTRMNTATNQFVIELAGVELPPSLQRPYKMSDFKSRIAGINAYQSKGSDTARVVLQMSAMGAGEPIVQQEGTSLVVIPPAAPAPVVEAPAPKTEEESSGGSERALSARTLDEFLTGNQKFFGKLISLQVRDADIRDVINFLAEESGANIVMSDDVEGKISLKLRRVPWDQALVTLMRTKTLGYVRQGNVLRISTLKSLQAETEAANKIIESQKAIVPSIVRVFSVSYANLEELVKNLTPFLSAEGKIIADNRTNTVVVTDKEVAVERIAKLAKTLDIPPAQVSIESKVVEAAEDFSRFIGITWSQFGSPVNLSQSGGAQGAPIDLTLNTLSGNLSKEFRKGQPFNMDLNIASLDFFGNLSAALTLAERDSMAKVISAPRISTMNREKATIRQEGENVTISSLFVSSSNTVTKSVNRTPFKLELSVTPQITAEGSVIMDLEVTREFLGAVVEAETQARPINKRFSKTKVLVRNGQTAVIGGIFTSDEIESNEGIPGIKNIPVLGWLFKNNSFSRVKNELLVFMTPRILGQDLGTKTAAN